MPKPDGLTIAVARSLFRVDKADPKRAADDPLEWATSRPQYLRHAERLLRTFEKDGLELTAVSGTEPTP